MIMVTRVNGTCFALNPDLVERVEATPDTVVTLVGGTKYIVAESVQQVIDRVRGFRASVLAAADSLGAGTAGLADALGNAGATPGTRPSHLRPISDAER